MEDDGSSPSGAARSRPRYRLADLLAQMAPDERHEEVDWGEARGEEVW